MLYEHVVTYENKEQIGTFKTRVSTSNYNKMAHQTRVKSYFFFF